MDIVSKSTGDSWAAAEQNQITNELENALSSTGQTPAAGDLFQIGKAMADYSSHGDFFIDSGAASAYVLTAGSPKQSPTAYSDGGMVRFVPGNTNTGASTANVATLGVVDIKSYDGSTLIAGDIVAGKLTEMYYDTASGDFFLSDGARTGEIVQVANFQTGAVNTGTTVMVNDDTIPQNTEGDEYMTLAFTPKSATNNLKIDIEWFGSHSSTTAGMYMALFQDTTVDALAAAWGTKNAIATGAVGLTMSHFMVAGTASSTTFKVRAGAAVAGTTTFNGGGGLRLFGGVVPSSITITEIKV